ncbi:GNAT family N-acetyltransferase [Melittangium boletus]|uniref:Acetyltransferase n=1 Tax=Melittangium boletus DSM 14713 TaxID=1294270 RepID=A0A250ICQ4_9BACT|nr:GNAT family N-acetyltransferase [Melittangium boletus]ATB28998.1 acetyltransferase [Melittangium boletus DSM 14713]
MRPATPEDAAIVVRLMYTAIGDIAHTLSGTRDKAEALRVLESFFRQARNRVSHEHVWVHEADGRVIGFLSAYHGSQIPDLDRPFIERLRAIGGDPSGVIPEAREDEYYLDSLAVDADYQGGGIGTLLLDAFERKADALGHPKIMLLVDQENTKARRLYERRGYREDGSLLLSGHVFDRMIKNGPWG